MSEQTKIQWCDSTINFWSGCAKVSDGCKNCYAEKMDNRHLIEKVSHWGKGAPRLKSVGAVKMALALNRKPWICDGCGQAFATNNITNISAPGSEFCCNADYHRRRVFSLSRGDWLDEEAPIEWLAEMLDTIRRCENLDWLLVTKRPELWKQRMIDCVEKVQDAFVAKWLGGDSPANVMVLTSVENQKAADERIPAVLKIPAARRGLSCEPLLGEVHFDPHWLGAGGRSGRNYGQPQIDWVISGCESGLGRRNGDGYYEQAIHLMEQCKAAGVPFFHKQMAVSNKVTGNLEDFPEELQVREFYK